MLCFALGSFRPTADPGTALASLLEADRAYGARAPRVPFVQMAPDLLAEGAILPSATLVVGRAAVIARLEQGRLGGGAMASWSPVRGGISADGAAGFTYGFMTITRGDSTSPAKYLAFWVRERDTWRIQALKIGGRPIGAESSTRRFPDVLPGDGWTSAAPDSLAAVRTLTEAERVFARAGSGALGVAFSAFGDSLAGHLGQGAEFLFGREQIAADVRASAGDLRLTWGPDIVHVARSGDLGVSAGYIRVVGDSTLPPRPFFTIWRRASPRAPWRYIAE